MARASILTVLGNWAQWLEAARRARRLRRQRNSVHTRLMQVCIRLDEARRYVDRDRAAERKERDWLILQRHIYRGKLAEMEDLIRASIQGQALLQAELTAQQAREALASDFGALDDS